MKKVVVLVILVLFLCSCAKEEKVEVKEISCTKMKELVSNGAFLLDVRSEEEYNINHLHEAVNYPYETIGEEISSSLSNKESVIIVYCQSGRRSAIAAQTLLDLGYKHVYDLGAIGNC